MIKREESGVAYRYNSDKNNDLEFWYNSINCWIKSASNNYEDVKGFWIFSHLVKYEDTWCEPYDGMEK